MASVDIDTKGIAGIAAAAIIIFSIVMLAKSEWGTSNQQTKNVNAKKAQAGALLAGAEQFERRAYSGSRILMLVSDGAAQVDPDMRERITRALNKLSALGYLRRERDVADRRNIFITRTPKGAEFLDAFHLFIAGTARDDRYEQPRAERTA